MEIGNSWSLLRSGRIEEGLRRIDGWYPNKPTASNIMERGVALLWAGDYSAAWHHFGAAIEKHPGHSSRFYTMAGTAKWCMDEPEAGVKMWKAGLSAEYSDAANVGVPLLLWFASIVGPGSFKGSEAEELLAIRLRERRSQIWPGPVAQYILGRASYTELQSQYPGRNETETVMRRWRAEFYEAVMELSTGNIAHYKEMMRAAADSSRPEWSDENSFLRLVWHEEFFIARHEARR
jgi:lipoprotein NlpI